jgi:protein SCO1/2
LVYVFGVLRPFSNNDIKINGVYLKHPKEIPNLHLVDQYGKALDKDRLKGHWTLLFFGFTHCPMICPATFDTLTKMRELLEQQLPASSLPQMVFITIDPERDTQERLNQYVNAYHPVFIGARTDDINTKLLKKSFSMSDSNIYAHNTDILLLNPNAQIQAYFLYPHLAKSMAADYVKIVGVKPKL